MPNNGYQSPATRLAAKVRALEETDVAQNSAIDEGGSGGALSYQDTMTGDVSTTSTAADGVATLRVDAGAPLGFDVPEQPAGSYLLITLAGAVRCATGDSGRPHIWPTVNGTEIGASRCSVASNGATPCPVSRTYRVALGSGTTEVRVRWKDGVGWGAGVSCTPADSDNPTCLTISGIVTR